MKVEIVEFYLAKEGPKVTTGTIHIHLGDYGIDIRGILAVKKKTGRWLFYFPQKSAFDEDAQKEIKFPVIDFADRSKKEEILDHLFKNGPAFIAKCMLDGPKRTRSTLMIGKPKTKPERPKFSTARKGELTYRARLGRVLD